MGARARPGARGAVKNSVQNTDVIVRAATSADVNAVTAIERECFTLPWSRGSFANLVRSPGVEFLVAVAENGDVRGYAITLQAIEACELANLAVTGTSRGQGVGRLLLNAAIDGARAHEAHEIFLEVRASNTSAQALYASVGFREVARRRRYYDKPVEDALVLRLDLRAAARSGANSTPAT